MGIRQDFIFAAEIHRKLLSLYSILICALLPSYLFYPLLEMSTVMMCDILPGRGIRYVIMRAVWYYFLDTELYLPLWLAFGVYGTYMIPGNKRAYKSSRGTERLEFFLQPFYYMLFLPASLLCCLNMELGILAAHILLFYFDETATSKYQSVIPVGNTYIFSPFDWL